MAIAESAIFAINERINSLETRISALEQQPEIDYQAPYSTMEQCLAHTCTYYREYLSRGPADLAHEGFHAAEYKAAQHIETCTRTGRCQLCLDHERRVRA